MLELLNNETQRKYQMDGFNEIHKIMKKSVDEKKLEDLFNTYLS